jgi:hypothetical protein
MSFGSPLAVALAGFALAAGLNAQDPGLQMTNLGELRAPVFTGHKLTGKAAAQLGLVQARAAFKDQAFQEPVDPGGSLEVTNTGELRRFVYTGHKLTVGAGDGGPIKVLYAPSEDDDPAYRTAIAAAIGGGATCDYFDARAATPSVPTLLQYDAVYTWANFAYADNVAFGDNLAFYNDQGGTVILGVFCTYTSGNFLSGLIMTTSYCPVDSPLGTNHFSSSSYTSGGTTCIYTGVTNLTSTYRDVLVTQGTGDSDGFYADGEICHAFRGTSAITQGDVVYSNGAGAVQLGGTGQWGKAVGQACFCSLSGVKILYAPSEADDVPYRAAISAAAGGAAVDYFDATAGTPSSAILANYNAVHTWCNFDYADNVQFGDNLAAFAGNERAVVLGAFCTYTSGNFLSGQIMTAAYCPVVSPLGTNHFSDGTDAGPFFSCVTEGATSFTGFYRDVLVKQGDGIIDSKFDADKEIATAFRRGGPGDVIYVNGAGGFPVLGAGDWPLLIANSVLCSPGTDGPLATCTKNPGTLGNPDDTSCLSVPVVGEVWTVNVSTTPKVGTSTTLTIVTIGFGGPTTGGVVFGYELLILPPYIASTSLGVHNIPIPPVADFIGETLWWQGGRIEANPAVVVLTNGLSTVTGL